jgi:hypothetical protein
VFCMCVPLPREMTPPRLLEEGRQGRFPLIHDPAGWIWAGWLAHNCRRGCRDEAVREVVVSPEQPPTCQAALARFLLVEA